MSQDTIQIVKAGPLTTVQDGGCYGYQRFGVPVSGAMDPFALRVGNIMVGNRADSAALEMTMAGPTLRFVSDAQIAITGADMEPAVDGQALPQWQAIDVPAGTVLTFHVAVDGLRSYLCVSGGIDVPTVLGSRSTYLKSGFGGFRGRALEDGDALEVGRPELGAVTPLGSPPEPDLAPQYGGEHEIRVVMGPQHGAFTDRGKHNFLSSVYVVSSDSDRVGYRLEGPFIEHSGGADIVSDGSPPGAVQVPGDGLPIVLMADRGTTGGYPKIATVISSDVGKLAQARPGDHVWFKGVSLEEAEQVRWEQEGLVQAITGMSEADPTSEVDVVVDGVSYEIADPDGNPVGRAGQAHGVDSHTAHVTVGKRSFDFNVGVHHRG